VAAVGIQPGEGVVEIGPGLGDLTRELAAAARRVIALELDHGLIRALEEAGLPQNVEVRQGDALETDVPALGRELGEPCVLVGNLPYRVAGRLIAGLLRDVQLFASFRRLGFMVQREVADRLVAAPDTGDYGSLSVWSNLYAKPRRVLDFGPEAFVPRPKVRSAFVLLDPPTSLPNCPEPLVLAALITHAFRFRRKTLRRALSSWISDRSLLEEALSEAQIPGTARGETLSGEAFVRLACAIASRGIRG